MTGPIICQILTVVVAVVVVFVAIVLVFVVAFANLSNMLVNNAGYNVEPAQNVDTI